MALRIENKWVWDFWFAQNRQDYHIFYLQASRDLADEKLRHWHVSIGHAVSQDLKNWQILGDVLQPSANEFDWDSAATWTGSVIQHDGLWYLFYTGASRQENGLIQRIGLATSTNLMEWQKHSAGPVLAADPQWYEMLEPEMWYDHVWRDPWVFVCNGRFHAFITARSNQGHKSARGVIGHAWSEDLLHWRVGPPVAAPGEFGFMEVPQLVEINGRYYLIFCVGQDVYAETRRQRSGVKLVTGTHYMVSDQPLGPFRFLSDDFLLADEAGSAYAGKLIRDPQGDWVLMTSSAWTCEGGFIGEIADPMRLHIAADGQLHVAV